MAKGKGKGPRRPKIRTVVAVARPTHRVVHHVHHAGPSLRALGGLRRPVAPMAAPLARPLGMPLARPLVRPPIGAPGFNPGVGVPPRPPMTGVGPPAAPMGIPGGTVAPRAPLPGPMGPMGPLGPRRY